MQPSTDTPPLNSRKPRQWPNWKWWGFAAVIGACLVVVTRISPAGALNAISRHFDWGLSVKNVQMHWMKASMDIRGLEWSSPDIRLAIDDLSVRHIHWNGGHLSMQALALRGGQCIVATSDTLPKSTDAFDWVGLWQGPVRLFTIDSLTWESCDVAMPQAKAHVQSGALHGIKAAASEASIDSSSWSGWALNDEMKDTLVLGASFLAGRWSPESWFISTEGITLPGLRAVGSIQGPTLAGEGHAQLHWGSLIPWLVEDDLKAWMQKLELSEDSTAVSWAFTDTTWNGQLVGPSWLTASASSVNGVLNGRCEMAHLPAWLAQDAPCHSVLLEIQGPLHDLSWMLKGDSGLFATGTWNSTESVATAKLEAWHPFIGSPKHTMRLAASNQGDTWNWQAAQENLPSPWSAKGTFLRDLITFQGQLSHVDPTGNAPFDLQFNGAIQTADSTENAWNVDISSPSFEEIFQVTGRLSDRGNAQELQLNLNGGGVWAAIQTEDISQPWVELGHQWLLRQEPIWPRTTARVVVQPDNVLSASIWPNWRLREPLHASMEMDGEQMFGLFELSDFAWDDIEFDHGHVHWRSEGGQLFTNLQVEPLHPRGIWPVSIAADVRADTSWNLSLEVMLDSSRGSEWELEGTPGLHPDEDWSWAIHRGNLPLGEQQLEWAEVPFQWNAPLASPWPNAWSMVGLGGQIDMQRKGNQAGTLAISLDGHFEELSSVCQFLYPELRLDALDVKGVVTNRPHSTHPWAAGLTLEGQGLNWKEVRFEESTVRADWRRGKLSAKVEAAQPDLEAEMKGQLSFMPSEESLSNGELNLKQIPFAWLQPWVDSTTARLEGTFGANLSVGGTLQRPTLAGQGMVDTVIAEVPSLGTTFGASGTFLVEPDGLVLEYCRVQDQQGVVAPLHGALLHEAYRDWNLDISVGDIDEPMLIMNLPPSRDLPIHGQLVCRGQAGVFFWDDLITIHGDVIADAPTHFKMSLSTSSEESWNDLVKFVDPKSQLADAAMNPHREDIGVTLDLDIDVREGALATLITDPATNANISGRTKGKLRFVLEDWDRMDLRGELTIVEGAYDFALGQFVRKSFEAQPGGVLSWDGDPLQGSFALDAVHRTRANVQPLLSASDATGSQYENIDILLHLSGPMMTPNIAFDLDAPDADRLVSEALASAVIDENERTSQAIALLSLQEFLPPTINTLELGANGLQENSIDLVTSQMSRWLSQINEDLEIGIRYDAQNDVESNLASNQDALQLALKASFFDDKLEIEGAVGSASIQQEAMTQAHLQNIRVLYQLDEERGLQLTGFSETRSTTTQSANPQSQGIGLRWHKSFNWKWPWAHAPTDPNDAN